MELIHFYSVLILATFFIPCSTINLFEGDPATLSFEYPCNSTEVTLQHGYKTPFYRSTSSESLLTPDQEGRYTVKKNESVGTCSLLLTISQVKRSDAGTFICQVYRDSELLPEYPRIGLNIDYPPGKPSCQVSEGHVLEGWSAITCTASVGSLPGQIGCFQDGVLSPPVLDPTQNNHVLKHVFWVRHTYPVFCCSFRSAFPTGICDCKNFVKVPDENGLFDTTAEPCTIITSTYHSSSSSYSNQNIYSTGTLFLTTQETFYPHTPFYWISGLAIGLVSLISLVLCIALVYYFRAFKQLARLRQSSPESFRLEPYEHK